MMSDGPSIIGDLPGMALIWITGTARNIFDGFFDSAHNSFSWGAMFFHLLVIAFSIGIIIGFLYFTQQIFFKLQRLKYRISLVFTIGVIIFTICCYYIISNYNVFESYSFDNGVINLVIVIGGLLLLNVWLPFSVVLPTYFIYPEIREKQLWKDVVACFIVIIFCRFASEHFREFISWRSYPVVSWVSDYSGIIFGIQILMTIIISFIIYGLINELKLRVPQVKQWFVVE